MTAASPPAARITEFHRAGLTFPVIDSGPVDGDVVVLLHGFPQTPTSWRGTAEHLHAAGYRTVIPYQRGYAASAKPWGRWHYRGSQLVADIEELLELTGPAHLVGHDWGAAIAWQVAAARPDRVRTFTAVSVPHPLAFLRSMVRSNQALKSYYMGVFQLPLLPELVARLYPPFFAFMLRATRMPQPAIDAVLDELVRPGLIGGGVNWYRGLPLTVVRPGASAQVSVPVTYVWSDGDTALGRACADLSAQYADGPYRFVVFEGVSHWIPDERPAELAAEIVRRIENRHD